MTSQGKKYLSVPTDEELWEMVGERRRCSYNRQPSLTVSVGSAETGRRVRQLNERRRERLNTELLNAVSHSDEEEISKLLEDGASSRACCRQSGTTAIHLAAALGDTVALIQLLSHGADARAKDQKGREPVHMATWHNHLEVLEILVQKEPDVVKSCVEKDSYTEDQDVLDSWNHSHQGLDNMIPVDLEDGTTALHIASMRGYYSCLSFLIESNAEINYPSSSELTPIDVAGLHMVCSERDDKAHKSEYEDSPANFTQASFSLPLPRVFKAASKPLESNPLLKIYCELMNGGATMPKGRVLRPSEVRSWVQTKKTTTPLHTAVAKENCVAIRFLLNQGGCLMAWNSDEETALHLAVRNKLFEPLKAMLYWDADQCDAEGDRWESKVDVRDGQGMTPLLLAAKLQWADGVALLLEEGADVTVSSNKNETVLHFAARLGDARMIREFLSVPNSAQIIERRDDQKSTPVCRAVESKSLECLKVLSQYKANLAVTMSGNVTMLHRAAEINVPEIIEFLLQDEAVIQQGQVDKVCKLEKGGVAPIHIAALGGFGECVQELIRGGCDVRVTTKEESHRGSSALHLAAQRGHLGAVESILGRDSKSHQSRDSDGWSPLHVAAARGHSNCVRALLGAGADLGATFRDESGKRTAVDLIMLCIPHPVNFLETILDSYITMDGESISDENCQITVKYDVLVPDDRCQRQLRVMSALLNGGKVDTIQRLLLHPVIETFLYLKWRKLRVFFVMIMLLYIIMTVSLTVYSHLMYVEKSASPVALFCANIASILLISVDIIILFLEIMNLIQLHHYYIRDFESLIKWGMIVTAFVVGLADPTYSWTKYVAATSVLLAWIELLFLLARCPAWGYYVLMFSRVAVNVLKVLSTFVLLFIGFSFSFLILFEATEPFKNFFVSFIKVLVMTLEFDYQDMFEPIKDVKAMSITGRLIFIAFLILVSIVMMNLMLGLAVSDISALEAQGKTQRLVKQTQFLSLLEMVVYNRTLKKLLPPKIYETFEDKRAVDDKIIVRPAKPIESINHRLPRSLRESVIDTIWSKTQAEDVQATIDLHDLNKKIDDLTDQVRANNHPVASTAQCDESCLQKLMLRLDDIQREQLDLRTVVDQRILAQPVYRQYKHQNANRTMLA